MTKAQLKKTVTEYEKEFLAWFNEEQLNEMGVQFRTLEKALDEGWLIYEGGDDIYVGKLTYKKLY